MRRLSVFIFILFLAVTDSNILSQGNVPTNDNSAEQPYGFGSLQWETSISEAKEKVIGKIVYYDEKSVIVSKDGDIKYLYGFFYIDPVLAMPEDKDSVKEDSAIKEEKQVPQQKTSEAKLFYVSVQFPYLTIEDVRKKIEEKYGPPTGEDIKDNQGAIIWESEKTSIIMWIDRYEGRSFCKKINYVGKELAGKVNEYQKLIFNKSEIDILKRLSL